MPVKKYRKMATKPAARRKPRRKVTKTKRKKY